MDKELIEKIETKIGTDIESLLPPEFLLDETHPANQQFFKTVRSIDAQIRGLSYGVKAQEIQTAMRSYRGETAKEIAKALKLSVHTIRKYKNTETFAKLISLYAYREQFSQSPTQEMKENLLWTIANECKTHTPSASIAAIRELNNMENSRNERVDRLKGLMGGQTTVIINPDTMPRTSLDSLPLTVEQEQNQRAIEGEVIPQQGGQA